MIKRRLLSALLVVLAACVAPTDSKEPQAGEEVRSNLQRITSPAPSTNVDAAVRGLNEFSFDLHRKVGAAEPGNFITSPTSITTALSAASAGAATTTLDAFRDTLNVSLPQNDFHLAMNTLDAALQSRGQGQQGTNGRPFRVSIVNQTFAQNGFHLEQRYLDLLAQQYGAGVRLLDFKTQAELARTDINEWVSFHTEALIPQLLAPGAVNSATRVVLVNAVYFDASWASPFNKQSTSSGAFTLSDGSTVQTDTMRDSVHPARAATLNGVEVVELPYQGDELSMLLVMPPLGELAQVEAALTPEVLDGYLTALTSQQLEFTLPKFGFNTRSALADPLSELGLGVAFSDDADFSAMTGDRSLQITGVTHEAVIKVTEEGTEAAGATAVEFGTTSVPQTRPLHVDRPFLFMIRDNATGAVLFLGRVIDPR